MSSYTIIRLLIRQLAYFLHNIRDNQHISLCFEVRGVVFFCVEYIYAISRLIVDILLIIMHFSIR